MRGDTCAVVRFPRSRLLVAIGVAILIKRLESLVHFVFIYVINAAIIIIVAHG